MMNLTVMHHIPGRIRWKADRRLTEDLACRIASCVAALPGVTGVRVSPRTGTVLLVYRTSEALAAVRAVLAGICLREASIEAPRGLLPLAKELLARAASVVIPPCRRAARRYN